MRTLDSVSHVVYREGERADQIEVLVAGLPLDQKVRVPWTVAWAKARRKTNGTLQTFQYGPFVMNSQEELLQAVRDFQNAENGFERSLGWRSKIGQRA